MCLVGGKVMKLNNLKSILLKINVILLIILIIITQRESINSQQPISLPLEMTAEPTSIVGSTATIEVNMEQYAPANYGIPNIIAGYKVLAVFSSYNTICIPKDKIRVVVQVEERTVDSLLQSTTYQTIVAAFEQLNITVDVQIVGPEVEKEVILQENERWNSYARIHGCKKSQKPSDIDAFEYIDSPDTIIPLPKTDNEDLDQDQSNNNTKASPRTGNDGQIVLRPSPSNGYAIFENINAGSFLDDNGQAVSIIAPSIGPGQDLYSAIFNNIQVDSPIYYVQQNGLGFDTNQPGGSVVWTNDNYYYII